MKLLVEQKVTIMAMTTETRNDDAGNNNVVMRRRLEFLYKNYNYLISLFNEE